MNSKHHITVCVLGAEWDEKRLAVLDGLRAYRDRHGLAWRVLGLGSEDPSKWPERAYWVLLKPSLQGRVRRRAPQQPLFAIHGSASSAIVRTCTLDTAAIGRTAHQHFKEQGYRRFATGEFDKHPEMQRRRQGFVKACAQSGESCLYIRRDPHLSQQQQEASLRKQLTEENKRGPLAFFLANDAEAHWLRGLCRAQNIRVPDDVALLGAGNHLNTCLSDEPALSSIIFPWRAMAQTAAEALHRSIQGLPTQPPARLSLFQVAERRSSSPATVSDPELTKALQWLERDLDHPQPLQGLASALGLSRATICRKFRRGLGQSPKAQQELFRLTKATHLLEQSHLSLSEIAALCGYSSSLAFGVAFKRRRGLPPSKWRTEMRE